MKKAITVLAFIFAMPNAGFAQSSGEITVQPLDDLGAVDNAAEFVIDEPFNDEESFLLGSSKNVINETQDKVKSASSANIRVLDRLTGQVEDIELAIGQVENFGKLSIFLSECRYPIANPASDAYINIVVRVTDAQDPVFAGWMVASSPALNAMDHERYDVWALSCKSS